MNHTLVSKVKCQKKSYIIFSYRLMNKHNGRAKKESNTIAKTLKTSMHKSQTNLFTALINVVDRSCVAHYFALQTNEKKSESVRAVRCYIFHIFAKLKTHFLQ